MRGKKVTAIKRAATKLNDGEKPKKRDMRILKLWNKCVSIPTIKDGGLLQTGPQPFYP